MDDLLEGLLEPLFELLAEGIGHLFEWLFDGMGDLFQLFGQLIWGIFQLIGGVLESLFQHSPSFDGGGGVGGDVISSFIEPPISHWAQRKHDEKRRHKHEEIPYSDRFR